MVRPGVPHKYSKKCVCRNVLTLAMLGKDTGSDATDILSADAGVLDLHLDCRQ